MNTQAIDYCPFCCVEHVIGNHPDEGETPAQYWARVDQATDLAKMLHDISSTAVPTNVPVMIDSRITIVELIHGLASSDLSLVNDGKGGLRITRAPL
jgi:hypothetical protein